MRLARFQFTLRQLIGLIIICAVSFAVLRTPAGPWIVAIGLILPGFLIDRARGRVGILGGMLAGGIGFIGSLIASSFYYAFSLLPGAVYDFPLALLLPFAGVFGLIWGLLVSMALCMVISLTRVFIDRRPLRDESCGPIVWRGLENVPKKTTR